jgi:RimJ/RimL family protein N-acetyltransferase
MSVEVVEGARIRLRPMRVEDVDVYRSWLVRPGAAWRALDGPYYPVPEGDALDQMHAKMVAWIEAGHEPDPLRRVAVADRETDALVGTVNRYWISEETHWPAIGISLFDDAVWGRGLGFEALTLWVDTVFRMHPEIVRIDMRTWSGNVRMVRLAEKLGFQREACFRKARIVDGAYYDGLGYGVLREEWSASRPAGG